MIKLVTNQGCVLVYRYTKERNINELRHNSMYGYENNRNSPVYRYTRTAPKSVFSAGLRAYLHGTTLSHAKSLRKAYDTNCFV